MRKAVPAFVLCLFAATSGAMAATEQPTATTAPVMTAAQTPAAVQPAEVLVKTAGAVTHDGAPSTRAGASHAQAGDEDAQNQQATSISMLLAALALMLGIAWRRFSADEQ